jgi:hypothetical protein
MYLLKQTKSGSNTLFSIERVARRMWARQESLQGINSEWHKNRAEARRTAFSVEEFGDIEQTKYDLDTAGITGADNPQSYTVDRPLNSIDGEMNNGTDIRTLNNR